MIVELTALIAAVSGLSTLVEKSADAVSNIRGGAFGGAKKKAEAAASELAQLKTNLASVGALARFAESYLRLHEDLTQLLDVTERLHRTVEESRPVLEAAGSEQRKVKWETVAELNATTTERAAVVRRVIRGDEEYFDDHDRTAIELELEEVSHDLVRIDELIKGKNAADLQRELAGVITTIRNTSERTQATLGRILGALRGVGSPAHA
jgi:hypothetical protein